MMRKKQVAWMLVVLLCYQLVSGTLVTFAAEESTPDGTSVTSSVYGEGGGGEGDLIGDPGLGNDTVTDLVYGYGSMPKMMSLLTEPMTQQNKCNSGSGLEVCVSSGYAFGNIVLGQERTIDVTLKNTTGAYMFNAGVELVLGDGLEIVSPEPSSVEVDASSGVQTAYWKDIKNLQGGESYIFPVTVKSTDKYRAVPEIEVPFGAAIPFTVNMYFSEDARTIVGPPAVNAKASVNMNWTIVPFTIIPSEAAKVVKGAGEDATEVDEWGEFAFSFEIVNNDRYATTFSRLSNTTDGSVQIYELSDAGAVDRDYANNIRSFAWTNLHVGRGATKTLTLHGAFLNKTMNPDPELAFGDNQGSLILDGYRPASMLEYTADAVSGNGVYGLAGQGMIDYDLAVAKDIVIHKSVASSDTAIGYGTILTYTLTVKTNEYYEVEDVVITDTIGDGQTLVPGSITAPSDFTPGTPVVSGDGTTNVTWSVVDGAPVAQKQTRTFTYQTIVNSNWLSNNAPIYAGDRIVNDVEVTGTTEVSGSVHDHDATEVRINEPGIREIISGLNEASVSVEKINATVGDTVDFTVTYDASDVNAKQNEVEIRDYLPLGTVPLAYQLGEGVGYTLVDGDIILNKDNALYAIALSSGYVYPTYDVASNMLIWNLPVLDESTTILTAKVVVKVLDSEQHVTKDKGDKNLVTLSYKNTPGVVESKRASVAVDYTEPKIEVTRQVSNNNTSYAADIMVNGTEIAWVKRVLENKGATPAYNVVLTEVLPSEFKDGIITPISGDFVYNSGVFTLNNAIPAGGTFTIIYSTTIINDIGAGEEISQSSNIVYNSQPGGGRPYAHAADAEAVTMKVPHPTIAYTKVHYGSDNALVVGQDWNRVRVGDWVVYKVVVDVPTGDVAYNPELKVTLPSNHGLVTIFDNSYDAATFTGTELTPATDYAVSAGNVISFAASKLPQTAGVDHIFYIKTLVNGITNVSSHEELQKSSSSFSWKDQAGTGTLRNIDSAVVDLTVTIPELTGTWYYKSGASFVEYDDANPVTLSQTEELEMQFRIENVGKNSAYDFVPVLSVPAGFLITGSTGTTPVLSGTDTVATYPKVEQQAVGAGAVTSYTIKVKMNEVPGSGANFTVDGTTGAYYSTPYAFDSSSIKPLEKYAPATDAAVLGVPNVSITNKIIATTNSEVTSTFPSDSAIIRTGDVVTYEMNVVVPPGTQAFNLIVKDQIANFGKFDFIAGSGLISWNQNSPLALPASVALEDTDYNTATGMLTVDLEDSPMPSIVNSVDGTVTYSITFKMRAKEDGSKPTGASAGSFNIVDPVLATSSSASVGWDTKDTGGVHNDTVITPVTTSLAVKQPDVSITGGTVSTFTEAVATQTSTYAIKNTGASTAYIPKFELKIPAGFNVSNETDLAGIGGTYSKTGDVTTGYTLVWSNFPVSAGGTLNIAVDLTLTAAIGAAQAGLNLTATLEHYHSTKAIIDPLSAPAPMKAKVYVLDPAVLTPALTIAPVTVTATLKGNSYGDIVAPVEVRPGDVLNYDVIINLPGSSPAYGVILDAGILSGQEIIGVELNGLIIQPISNGAHGGGRDGDYWIGDLIADKTVKVFTKVAAIEGAGTTSYVPSLTYHALAGSSDASKSASATKLEQTIIEPSVSVEITAVPTTLADATATSDVEVTLKNTGTSMGHATRLTVTIDQMDLFDLTDLTHTVFGSPTSDVVAAGTRTLVWEAIDVPIDAVGKALLEFKVKAKANTALDEVLTVTATVEEYHSLPAEAAFKTAVTSALGASVVLTELELTETALLQDVEYGPHTPVSAVVALTGAHTLVADGSASIFAGGEATLSHTLTNTGAGQDTFTLTIAGPTTVLPAHLAAYIAALPDEAVVAQLTVAGVPVLTGQLKADRNGFEWVCVADVTDCVNGSYSIVLNANEQAAIALTVYVSEFVSYLTTPGLTYTITADSGAGNTASVTDTITVSGTALDGWSGAQQQAPWTLANATYQHGEGLVLNAVTSNHIQEVVASVVGVAGMDSFSLKLINDDVLLADYYGTTGKKQWKYVDDTAQLLNNLAEDNYEVTFKSYTDKAGTVLDQTDVTGVTAPGINNPFAIIVPNVSFTLEPIDSSDDPIMDPIILDTANETATYRLTIVNNGTSVANDAIAKMDLGAGILIKSIGDSSVSTDVITPNVGMSSFEWSMSAIPANGGTRTVTFDVEAPVSTLVTPSIAVSANVLEFHSLSGAAGGGKEYGPLTEQQLSVAIAGQHTLVADKDLELTAGQEAVFEHTLTNTGAGKDTFVLDVAGPYAAKLYVVSTGTEQLIGSGEWVAGAWVWDAQSLDAAYSEAGKPAIQLNAGAVAALKLVVAVPMNATEGSATTHTLAAASLIGNQVKSVEDSITVIAPSLEMTLTAVTNTTLTVPTSNTEFKLLVENKGTNPAYTAKVVVKLDEGLYLRDTDTLAAIPGVTVTGVDSFTWVIDELDIDDSVDLRFKVGSLMTTEVDAAVAVTAQVTEYYALVAGIGKEYPALPEQDISLIIMGSHTLVKDEELELTAGQVAEFEHFLTNTGAGKDTFVLDVAGPYAAKLYVVATGTEQLIGSGKWVAGAWVWDAQSLNAAYSEAGKPAIPLNAGQAATLKLAVEVPENVARGTITSHTLTATGLISTQNADVADQITITGIPLDGWSGDQERAGWVIPTYGRVDSVTLNAVSDVNAKNVKAVVTVNVVQAGGTATEQLEVDLHTINNDSYISNGYKQWKGTVRLPAHVQAGKYDVIFQAVDASEADLERDSVADNPTVAANNPIAVETLLDIKGTITDAATGDLIVGAIVDLYDPRKNEIVRTAITGTQGSYEFTDVDATQYQLIVSSTGYSNSITNFYALPEYGQFTAAGNVVIVDAALSPYQITLTANPSSILGDGLSQTELRAVITDIDGNPLAGVEAEFSSPTGKGSFPNGTVAITDENGVATVKFQSDIVGGSSSVRLPVDMKVADVEHNLHATAQITITFEPGAIIGVVTEMIDGNKVTVAGAIVVVTNEELGFYARYVTGADGAYVIGVPVGNKEYKVVITKPVIIDGAEQLISFPQTATVGAIPADQYVKYPSNKVGSGQILLQKPDGQATYFAAGIYNHMQIVLIDENDGEIPATINADGTFNVQSLSPGTYQLRVLMPTGDPSNTVLLAASQTVLNVSVDGEMNIVTSLVDPYGDVRNIHTNALIEGATVTLYYSDTKLPVTLPTLIGFDPFDNKSPSQITSADGEFAWMVYPETDYYIVATAPGYHTYTSPNIRVDWDIVKHDIKMTPIPSPSGGGGGIFIPVPPVPESTGIEIDLAIDISADQRSYMENMPIELTVDYINRSSAPATDAVITLDLPAFTTVIDLGGGKLSKDGKQINWTFEQLAGGKTGQLTIKLLASKITSSEQMLDIKAVIISRDKLIHLLDDISSLKLMLFSNDYGDFLHNRYIVGYPDGEFKPNRNISRAEIANIFARILQLREYVKGETLYNDVPQGQWYTDGVEAATQRGLFQGYKDGSFQPNQPITRAELVAVIGKFLELSDRPPVTIQFKDLTGHWAANMIENVRRNRVAQGYVDGSFKPNSYLVRSEAVTMINRMLYRGPLNGVDPSYLDVIEKDWEHGDVEESTRSHAARRNPDSSEQFLREIDTTLGF
jgi:hypothetical protein